MLARIPIALAALLAAILLAACGGDDEEEAPAPDPEAAQAERQCEEVTEPEPKDDRYNRPGQVLEDGEEASAVVETNCGAFTIELDTRRAPETANSFAFLAEEGFYDETLIHRIAPGFVIQGGDPQGDGTGGPGYSVDEPPPGGISYLRGVVAMAKTEAEPPGRSGSQFFVVTAPADAGLPADYALLGEVGEGMDVVETISQLGDGQEQPTETVVIESVTIERG